jgi:Na+/H+ antiporter NhaD/arsenite permease-like protein
MIETAVFVSVYAAMLLGGVPRMAIDRTGAALLGAIILIASKSVTPDAAWRAIDIPTLGLLFGLMVISAQFRLGGFYTAVTKKLVVAPVSPPVLLGYLMLLAGGLSAVLCNDIVCLAVTPILIEGCLRRNLNPLPFLIALACASNIGSAATLIGNPQNMLIGQKLNLSFAGYFVIALPPTLISMLAAWVIIVRKNRDNWASELNAPIIASPPLNLWQSGKGFAVLAVVIAGFVCLPVQREILALGGAGILLCSRRMGTRVMLGLVDWHLLLLFGGLFVVNHALQSVGIVQVTMNSMKDANIDPSHPVFLFSLTSLLSNLVSNVPATMLLLPSATHPMAGPIMALSSTLVGNLIIISSIANIIVVEQAAILGIRINWRQHARIGVPVTLVTLAIAAGWLWLLASVFRPVS